MRMRLAMKPGISSDLVVVLPIAADRAIVVSYVASLVARPLMISTNFMTGTGFMKCMPMTFSGLSTAAAILVMEMDEVLVARITSSRVAAAKNTVGALYKHRRGII